MNKVKVEILFDSLECFYWICDNFNKCEIKHNFYFKSRSSAIRNARQFFKKLGYEIEVEK